MQLLLNGLCLMASGLVGVCKDVLKYTVCGAGSDAGRQCRRICREGHQEHCS